MKKNTRREPKFFPWRSRLRQWLLTPEPNKKIDREWLEKHRWWWRWVEDAITKHAKEQSEDRRLTPEMRNEWPQVTMDEWRKMFMNGWRQVMASAFVYELSRRCSKGAGRRVPAWPALSDADLAEVSQPFLSRKATETPPLVMRSWEASKGKEWPFQPIHSFQDPHGDLRLYDKHEPAWTEPEVIAVNLRLSNASILEEFQSWLKDVRASKGIRNPKGRATQGVGERVWRFVEALDLRRYELAMTETEHSNASKAQTMDQELVELGKTYSWDFVVRIVTQDVALCGKVKDENLPLGRPRPPK